MEGELLKYMQDLDEYADVSGECVWSYQRPALTALILGGEKQRLAA